MIYSYANGVLTTYNVKVDTEKLEQINESIMENCSVIKHCSISLEKDIKNKVAKIISMNQKGKTLIANVCQDKKQSDQNFDVYNYDEYIYPSIINLIKYILKGRLELLKGLFNTADVGVTEENIIKYNYQTILDAIDALSKFIHEEAKTGFANNLVKAKELIDDYNYCEITLPKKSIKDYYGELQTCFELTKVQEFSAELEELDKLKEQYGDNWYEELISKLNNLKKLEEAKETSVDYQFIKRFGKSGKSKKN